MDKYSETVLTVMGWTEREQKLIVAVRGVAERSSLLRPLRKEPERNSPYKHNGETRAR